jgi:hypothetical protein
VGLTTARNCTKGASNSEKSARKCWRRLALNKLDLKLTRQHFSRWPTWMTSKGRRELKTSWSTTANGKLNELKSFKGRSHWAKWKSWISVLKFWKVLRRSLSGERPECQTNSVWDLELQARVAIRATDLKEAAGINLKVCTKMLNDAMNANSTFTALALTLSARSSQLSWASRGLVTVMEGGAELTDLSCLKGWVKDWVLAVKDPNCF